MAVRFLGGTASCPAQARRLGRASRNSLSHLTPPKELQHGGELRRVRRNPARDGGNLVPEPGLNRRESPDSKESNTGAKGASQGLYHSTLRTYEPFAGRFSDARLLQSRHTRGAPAAHLCAKRDSYCRARRARQTRNPHPMGFKGTHCSITVIPPRYHHRLHASP